MDIAKKTLTVCSVVTLFFGLLYIFFLARAILLYIVIALFLVIAIAPLVARFEKWKIKKTWAIILADVLLMIVFFGILALVITPLIAQGISLIQSFPAILHGIIANPTYSHLIDKLHLANSLDTFANNSSALFLTGSMSLLSIAGSVLTTFTTLSIMFVLTILLQFEGKKIWVSLLSFFDETNAKNIDRIAKRITTSVSGFVSGNLFISLIAGVVTFLTLVILGVPYKIPLAALVALFDLIPLIGAAIGTIVVALVALTQSLVTAVIAVVILLVYQFVEGHVIQPLVYSRSVNLSALFIVIASVLGAELGGIIGMLLAIPAAAILEIMANETYVYFKGRKTRAIKTEA